MTERRYWAFMANPQVIRIEDELRDVEVSTWATRGSNPRRGDRALIWKATGDGSHRGIIALAEVLSDPQARENEHPEYWVISPKQPIEERIRIRYVRPRGVPMWMGQGNDQLLLNLTVSRGWGHPVFHVSPDEWGRVLKAIGGWPGDSPEVGEAEEAIAQQAGRRLSGQAFQVDAEVRRVVEAMAMDRAAQYYSSAGWHVKNVSTDHSYDLLCTRGTEAVHVEVKGTTGSGSEVLLTRNEVQHALQVFPHVALFILANVRVTHDTSGHSMADGGQEVVLHPWAIDLGTLTPLSYSYSIPTP